MAGELAVARAKASEDVALIAASRAAQRSYCARSPSASHGRGPSSTLAKIAKTAAWRQQELPPGHRQAGLHPRQQLPLGPDQRRSLLESARHRHAAIEELYFGGVIGSVLITDIVTAHNSPWFHGPAALVLADPRPEPFLRLRGQVGCSESEPT